MVTTRSAEKLLALNGKTKHLAVRPKSGDVFSTPTPAGRSRDRARITINVPPPPGRDSQGSDTTVHGNKVLSDGEDSPYATANESPESLRGPPLALTTPTAATHYQPGHEEMFTPQTSLPKPVATVLGTADSASSPLKAIVKIDRPKAPVEALNPVPGSSTLLSVDTYGEPTQSHKLVRMEDNSSDVSEDEPPEIINTRSIGPTQPPKISRARKRGKTSLYKPAIPETRSADSPIVQNIADTTTVPLIRPSKDAEGVSEAHNSAQQERSQTEEHDSKSITRYGTDTSFDESFVIPRGVNTMPLLAKASTSLQDFRRNHIIKATTSKGRKRLRLQDEWSTKRRRFVVTT